MGTLFVVATPIGNLEDMTLRAIRTLREVRLIAAEDTRTSGRLLKHFQIETPQTSYFEHNKLAKRDVVLAALAQGDVALISDAGTPTISDPGYELVQAAWEAGHRVVPIPGPSAVTAALSVAGLPTDRVVFLGFLPRQASPRRALLESYVEAPETLVFYEAPHRIRESVDLLIELFGADRAVVLARELTKLHETIWRGTLADAAGHLVVTEPRGEYTVLLAGTSAERSRWDDDAVQRALLSLEAEGVTGSRAVKQVARLAERPRSDIYDLWLRLQAGE
ncbi:MAG: 16S rRNA (cytidine(1402)-2'-O)-methyltransferase [Anaerolineales bacterium]|nr:16S rRNA (cytidine(1402)-2'-O)-methyltransferase [Anaerolineales bacterium]MCB9128635.1 16S rRNA (cytidine(1402)-2'-O)-methyltransferase [Ardenticatenales bacterium]